MLQQANMQKDNASVLSTQEPPPNITPSLAALQDAQALMRKEWRRGEPGKEIPQQYSTLCGHLTPTQPRHEDMRMDSTFNVTPEGSLSNIPAASGGNVNLMEAQQMLGAPKNEMVSTQPSATLPYRAEGTSYTSVKVTSERASNRQRTRQPEMPRRVQRMKEASQEVALASARHFFVPGNGQNKVVSLGPSEEEPITTTIGTTLELPTLLLPPQSLLIALPLQLLELRWKVLDLSFLMGPLLGPLQQLLVDYEHGYRGFLRDGQVPLPQMVLNWEKVIYMNLLYLQMKRYQKI